MSDRPIDLVLSRVGTHKTHDNGYRAHCPVPDHLRGRSAGDFTNNVFPTHQRRCHCPSCRSMRIKLIIASRLNCTLDCASVISSYANMAAALGLGAYQIIDDASRYM